MDRGAWWATVHRVHWVAKSWTRLKQFNMHARIHTHTHTHTHTEASLVSQIVKNLHAMKETGVQSLDWKDPLEKRMATHWSILAWRIPWTEEPGGLQSIGSKIVGHN